mmetsp:Transcript_8346/g.13064  ORF Transcript_8346/g.13064 Transcript_8346/m.13064 type:complete len:122 (+) Transcript_8346:1198-1563(+)
MKALLNRRGASGAFLNLPAAEEYETFAAFLRENLASAGDLPILSSSFKLSFESIYFVPISSFVSLDSVIDRRHDCATDLIKARYSNNAQTSYVYFIEVFTTTDCRTAGKGAQRCDQASTNG